MPISFFSDVRFPHASTLVSWQAKHTFALHISPPATQVSIAINCSPWLFLTRAHFAQTGGAA